MFKRIDAGWMSNGAVSFHHNGRFTFRTLAMPREHEVMMK